MTDKAKKDEFLQFSVRDGTYYAEYKVVNDTKFEKINFEVSSLDSAH